MSKSKAEELIKTAQDLYRKAGDAIKCREILEQVFGKETFTFTTYVDQWEQFLKEFKMGHVKMPFDLDTTDREEQRTIAFHMLNIIVPKENKGWEADWDNGKYDKYQPYFKLSGSGFAYAHCDRWRTVAYCGSRLCSSSASECERIAKKYLAIYERAYNK